MTHSSRHLGSKVAIPACFVVAALCTVQPAWAVSDAERAGARAAAAEGAAAFEQGRWAEVIDRFRRAEAIVHSPVHLLYIARAHVQLGQLVEAQETFIKIANETLPADAPPPFHEAKQDAEKELGATEPRIPYVTIKVEGASTDPVVATMDGEQVPPTLVGVPRPVNPGEHRFRAKSGNLESEETSITLSEGAKETVVLALRPVEGGSDSAGAVTADTAGAEGEPSGGGVNGMRIGGFVGLGVGVVGLAVGTIFTVSASGKRSDADDEFAANMCGSMAGCPSEEERIQSMYDDADSAQTIGIVGFVVGGLGVATGVTLLVLSSGSSNSAKTPAIVPYAGLGTAGVVGRF